MSLPWKACLLHFPPLRSTLPIAIDLRRQIHQSFRSPALAPRIRILSSVSSQLFNLPFPSSTSPPGSRSSSSGVPLSLRPPLRSSRQSPSRHSVTSPSAALHGQSPLPPHTPRSCVPSCPPSRTSSALSPAPISPYGSRRSHSRSPSTSLSHCDPMTGCPRMSISSSSVSSARLPRLLSSDSPPLSLSASSQSTPALWSSVVSSRGYGSNLKGVNCLFTLPLLAASLLHPPSLLASGSPSLASNFTTHLLALSASLWHFLAHPLLPSMLLPVPIRFSPPSPVGSSPAGTAYSPCAFGIPLRLRGGFPSPRSPNFLLSFPCFHLDLPSELSNVQPFNMTMQDRYGLLANSRLSKTLITTADLNSLIAFRLQLRDCDRWVVDSWIGLLRSFLNSPPGLPGPCYSAISSSSSAPSSPPATILAASSY